MNKNGGEGHGREAELLPVPYFHVVFTLPADIGAVAYQNKAYLYDWNILPIGQLLWTKELMSYKEFPPMQAPETYNLDGILKEMQNSGHRSE